MKEEKINLNHVIESLSSQIQGHITALAYSNAIVQAKDERIKELEKELEQLRKEHIKQMDEEAK